MTSGDLAAPAFTPAYRRYALCLLLAIFTLNFLDRQVLNSLIEPIKHELGLRDWQLGLLSGLAFAAFYTVVGIPIARLAEHSHRPFIIAASVAVWSGMTALCGSAQNFVQLVLFRFGVGIGEAGCTPPAHSLISDVTPKEKLAGALAFYHMGTPFGALLGLAIGGLAADAYGWRWAFLAAGGPGLIVAVVTALTLKEPRKILGKLAAAPRSSFRQTLAALRDKPTFWLVVAGSSLKALFGYGMAAFTISFFLRNHGPRLAELSSHFGLGSLGFVSTAVGVVNAIGGASGALIGGMLADRLGRGHPKGYLTVAIVGGCVAVPLSMLAISVPSAVAALFLMLAQHLFGGAWFGPIFGAIQRVSPRQMRATSSALSQLATNLIGLGLGPLAVGAFSDFLQSLRLEDAGLTLEVCRISKDAACAAASAWGLRQALLWSSAISILPLSLYWLARRTIAKDIEA